MQQGGIESADHRDVPAGIVAGLSTVSRARCRRVTSVRQLAALVLRDNSASMTFYLAQGKGLPCCRHPVISVQ